MITSKLTSKAQTTIPQAVRTRLGLREGDMIGFSFENDKVVLTKVTSQSDDPFATFSEWESEADRRAYGGL